jgi:hypothetical protein
MSGAGVSGLVVRRVAAGVLFVLALFWLAALSKPGNVSGVVILEAVTLSPLVWLLIGLRRSSRAQRDMSSSGPVSAPIGPSTDSPLGWSQGVGQGSWPAAGRTDPSESVLPSPTPTPPPAPHFDPTAAPDVVLRPRVPIVIAAVVLAVGLPGLLFKLSYDQASFDPRVLFVTIYGLVLLGSVLLAKIVVADRSLIKRTALGRRRVVSLSDLAMVLVIRARPLKNGGLTPTSVLLVSDLYGRSALLSPRVWRRGALDLLAIIDACVHSQGLQVDEPTRALLTNASAASAGMLPGWTSMPPSRPPGEPGVHNVPYLPPPSSFWTRRRPDGRPLKFQAQRLVVVVAMLAVTIPLSLVTGRLGTDWVRSARCSAAQSLWTAAPDFPIGSATPGQISAQLQPVTMAGLSATTYQLTDGDIANKYNIPAVRRDAATIQQALDVVWAKGNDVLADIQIEQFPSHPDALAFQRDYGEDHCHEGDLVFSTPAIPGGMGLRCSCTGSTVQDRVSFIRGETRIQAIAWSLRRTQGHAVSLRLATTALQAEMRTANGPSG